MANSGSNANNSQFFITYAKAPHLNGKNTIFGKVIDGREGGLLIRRLASPVLPSPTLFQHPLIHFPA
jgi:cyclophilin family peptidyl-prolyl cis-trans isomerase